MKLLTETKTIELYLRKKYNTNSVDLEIEKKTKNWLSIISYCILSYSHFLYNKLSGISYCIISYHQNKCILSYCIINYHQNKCILSYCILTYLYLYNKLSKIKIKNTKLYKY